MSNPRPYRMRKSRHGKSWFRSSSLRKTQMGMLLKVGDLFEACDSYFNHIIAAIHHDWQPCGNFGICNKKDEGRAVMRRRGSFLHDIRLTDENGLWHYWGSCCGPAHEVSFVQEYYNTYLNMSDDQIALEVERGLWNPHMDAMRAIAKSGRPVCDEHGCMTEEVKKIFINRS